MDLLTVQRLVKIYSRQGFVGRARAGFGRPVVDDVSFRVGEGETFALVGESGSGKTTVAKMVAGLVRPTRGRVRILGVDVWRRGGGLGLDFRRQVQIVFQDPAGALDPRQRVAAAVGEPLLLHGLASSSRLRLEVDRLLDLVGLSESEGRRFPHQLSGGQKQRVLIARALALRPRLLLLDEPVSALDVSVRAQILNLLLDLQAELSLSYLFISHDLGVVRRVADRAAVMHSGRIVEEGPTGEIWSRPAHPYTESLLGAVPVLDPARRPATPERPPAELSLTAPDPGGGRYSATCLYAPLCPRAQRICRRRRPALGPIGEARTCACSFPRRQLATSLT